MYKRLKNAVMYDRTHVQKSSVEFSVTCTRLTCGKKTFTKYNSQETPERIQKFQHTQQGTGVHIIRVNQVER